MRLTDTPEWKNLRARVVGAGSLEVSYVLESSGSNLHSRKPRETFTIDSRGRTFLSATTTLIFSDANGMVMLDRKTGKRINGAPPEAKFGFFSFLGFLSGEALGFEPTTLIRLTAQSLDPVGSKVARVGWAWTETWIDTRQTFEVWFDPTTQFVDRVVTESSGMTLPVRRVYQLTWVIDPAIPANLFVPKFTPLERPGAPPNTEVFRFVPSPSLSEGLGRAVVRLPKGISGSIEIKGRTTAKSFGRSRIVTIPVGLYMVFTDWGTTSIRVVEGYDTVLNLGVMQLKGNSKIVVTRDGYEVVTLSRTRRSVALIPGEYRVKVAGSSRTVKVVDGLVTKV